MIKPAFHHYILAHTGTLSIALGVTGAIGLLLFSLHGDGALKGDLSIVALIILSAIPATGLGYVFGVAFIWMILGRIAARIQGWPFKIGDEVIILAGKHRGRITKIYEIWESRGQVRVCLGEDAKESVEDVYCAVAVTRTKAQVNQSQT